MQLASESSGMSQRLVAALTLLLVATVLMLLGLTYVGRGSSPYGMCEATNGQQVACDLLEPAPR